MAHPAACMQAAAAAAAHMQVDRGRRHQLRSCLGVQLRAGAQRQATDCPLPQYVPPSLQRRWRQSNVARSAMRLRSDDGSGAACNGLLGPGRELHPACQPGIVFRTNRSLKPGKVPAGRNVHTQPTGPTLLPEIAQVRNGLLTLLAPVPSVTCCREGTPWARAACADTRACRPTWARLRVQPAATTTLTSRGRR